MAFLALGEFGGDEFRRGALHHLLVEPRCEFLEQLGIAKEVARFEQRGADGHVRLGLADTFAHRACGVADLQPHVPEAVEQRLGNRLAPGGLLVREKKQQIDVGARRQQTAAVATGRHHCHVLGFRWHLRGIKRPPDEFEQDADDLILHLAQPLGAAPPVAVLEQKPLGLRARRCQRRFEALRRGRAQFALASGISLGELFQIGEDRRGIDEFGVAAGGTLDIEHDQYEIAKSTCAVIASAGLLR